MNRFLTRRKAKGENAETDGSSTPHLSGKTFRRNKKAAPQKPEVDLKNALPSSDDFRISLLMPKMSARFSMLREQDDPSSKIGKASDDSVIFKRASRLADLLHLPDDGSVRPPFARERLRSYDSADGYATDDDSMYGGSVMSRARPGEGNVLFGGRQKVYKIPAGGSASTKDLNASRARFLYEHDVHSTAFQSFRDERHPKSPEHEIDEDEGSRRNSSSRARSDSPHAYEYNPKRETTSSTESAPSNERSSTAATSVASQVVAGTPNHSTHAGSVASTPTSSSPVLPGASTGTSSKPQRIATKSRRLYEQGLDQHMHEQQSSALSRLDQLARQRAAGPLSPPPSVQPPPLSQAASVSNLRERYDRNPPSTLKLPASRSKSPPPPIASSDLASFNFGLGENKPLDAASGRNNTQSPPVSPIGNEFDAAIRPADRGKATATGTFTRPTSPYDDEQYSQRQLQMQRDRSNPASRKGSLADTNLPVESDMSHGGMLENNLHRNVTLEASSGLATQGTGDATADHRGNQQKSDVSQEAPSSSHSKFLASSSASVSSLGTENEGGAGRLLGLEHNNPHFNSSPEAQEQITQSAYHQVPSGLHLISTDQAMTSEPMAGLSGLVRQHLRTDSGQSSIHLAATPAPPRSAFNSAFLSSDIALPGLAPSERSSAADQDYSGIDQSIPKDSPVDSSQGQPGNNHPQHPSGMPFPALGTYQPEPLMVTANLRAQHTRNASSETQKARDEFVNELAERRKMVQENLKSFIESEGKSASLSREKSKTNHKRISPLRSPSALGSLKLKSTPGTSQALGAAVKPDTTSKAMKMLGRSGSEGATESSQVKKKLGSDQMKQEDDKMSRSIGPDSSGPQMRNWGQIRRDARRDFDRRQRETKETSKQGPSSKTPSPPSSSGSVRDRSGSDTSGGHPRARDGTLRDESPVTTSKAFGRLGPGHDSSQRGPHQPYPRIFARGPSHSSTNQAPPSEWPRFNGNASGPAPTRRRVLLPNRLEVVAPLDIPPRPSPIAPYSANSTPSLNTSPAPSSRNSPSQEIIPWSGTVPLHCKKVIQKRDISEPTLVSSTSDISTVDLPPGASLSNGADECTPPPVPAFNPRRKTRTVINGFLRGSDTTEVTPVKMPTPSSEEEKSTFSDDDSPPPKSRLWKPASEGGSLNARHRHHAAMAMSPRMPTFPLDAQRVPPVVTVAEGGMF
ncbi:MAG: hypothetical protein M1816_000650 [Peltula sp. TS41687]|nr:MAG: hypothetical protein M1816_000650 [Peltula sp. TS41687]